MSARTYAAFARLAAARTLRTPGELAGRVAFFVVILGVFASLWRAAAEAGLAVDADPRALVWYLATTEWIVLTAPPIYLEIEEAVRRGDVACQLIRPVSYVGAAFADALGVIAVRAPALGLAAWLCAFAFTGWAPPPAVLAAAVPLGVAAMALLAAIFLGIGLLAFWLEDVSPVYWVVQKLLFVLGGLMLPLEFYPEVLRGAAWLTPFPAVLAGPASLVLHGATAGFLACAVMLGVWGVAVGLGVRAIFGRAASAISINGG